MFSIFLGRCCHIFTFLRELFTISYLYLYLLFVLLVCSQYISAIYQPIPILFGWMSLTIKRIKTSQTLIYLLIGLHSILPPPLTKNNLFCLLVKNIFFLTFFLLSGLLHERLYILISYVYVYPSFVKKKISPLQFIYNFRFHRYWDKNLIL